MAFNELDQSKQGPSSTSPWQVTNQSDERLSKSQLGIGNYTEC